MQWKNNWNLEFTLRSDGKTHSQRHHEILWEAFLDLADQLRECSTRLDATWTQKGYVGPDAKLYTRINETLQTISNAQQAGNHGTV